MKTANLIFKSFQMKVTLVLILCMLFVGALSNFMIYRFTLQSNFNQLRDRLKLIAQTAVLMVDADTLTQVPLNREGMNTPQYKAIAEKLNSIKNINRSIRFVYTLAKTDKEGILQFVVDPIPPTAEEKKKGLTSNPGDQYNATRFPDMLHAFYGPTADRKLEIDAWGVTLSGYAPIRDKKGKSVAILGVDITADDVYKTTKEVHRRAVFVLAIGVLTSLALAMLISKRITRPIRRLVEATRHIARGDFHYQVDIGGADEIGELAKSFNRMSVNLYEARRKLHHYFYRVVQALVRILEARDHYTKGHSERVAEYSEKIALRMGFTREKVDLLKEAVVLHDIGKLGIQESILNKKGKLTDAEWEMVRQHPIIGEDILKPVLFTEEMLAMVRGHHERYDGRGYPDKLSGENINIFAQIVSVADAYDAMTVLRAYREALSKEEAIVEVKRNSGTQFSPKVVEFFLKILEE